ncbi:MAG: hypothetical protein ACOY94_23875 [Bacillota bacterium]
MADPREIQGSNAEVAEAGLNPEAAFAALTPATDHRMAMEVQARQEEGPGQLLANVRRQLEQQPGGVGAVYGRDEYEGLEAEVEE